MSGLIPLGAIDGALAMSGVSAVVAFFALAAAPGPATLSVAMTAMGHGRAAAMALSCGLSVSLALWGALCVAGLGPILAAWAPAFVILKIAGAGVLLWLAWGAARSALSPDADPVAEAPPARGGAGWFARGAALNGLNPKALVAWGAVIALGIGPETGARDLWSIWAVCSALGLAIYVVYAGIFGAAPVRRAYLRGRRLAEAAAALLFGAAGLRLLLWRAAPQ